MVLFRLRDGIIGRKHRKKVIRWLLSNKDREEKEAAMFRLWQETADEADNAIDASLPAARAIIERAERGAGRISAARRMMQVAAVLLLMLVGGGISQWLMPGRQSEEPAMVECFAPYGEQRSEVLPDGSLALLNAGTILIYPSEFRGKKRVVYLSGEANFEVRKNSSSRFTVHAGNIVVEALGTKFNVESYPGSGHIVTTLEEGAVKVYRSCRPGDAVLIRPSEQLTYLSADDNFLTVKKVNTANYTAWTKGELRFINKPLDEILFALERKFNVRFLADPNINTAELYSVKYKMHETIDDVIHVLSEIMHNVECRREGQTVRLFTKGKEAAR